MHAHKQVGATAVGQAHPGRQVHIHLRGARHQHLHAPGLQQPGHLQTDIQHHIGFPQPANADRAGIGAAMAGIDHHLEAAPGHHGQAVGRKRRPGGGERNLGQRGTGNGIQIALAEGRASLVGQAGELHAPAVAGRAHQAQAGGFQLGARGKFEHQAGGETIGAADAYLAQGATAPQGAGAGGGPGQIHPDPRPPKTRAGLKEGLGAHVLGGAQLQLARPGHPPGGQGGGPGGQIGQNHSEGSQGRCPERWF